MTFRLKTIFGIAFIESVLLLILVVSGLTFLKDLSEKNVQQRIDSTIKLAAVATKDALLSTDLATLENFVEEILATEDIIYIRIINNTGIVLAQGGNEDALSQPTVVDSSLSDVSDGLFDISFEISENSNVYGSIEMGLSTSAIELILIDARNWTAGIASLVIILVAIFSFILGTYLTTQLQRLKIATETITDSGPGHQIEVIGNDEIAEVTRSFNKMSSSLQQSYIQLKDSLDTQNNAIHDAIRNEAKNKAILAASLDALITIDADGRVIDYSSVAEEIFGWRYEEISGQTLANYIIPEEMREAHTRGMKHYLETGDGPVLGKRLELTAMHKDGHIFPIEIAISPTETDEEPMFTAFINDISERRANETKLITAQKQAEAASKAKSNFLATMSHEIRTPMNAVLGILGLLKDTTLDHSQLELVQTGRASGELLLTIINDILDFSKMEAEKLSLEKTSFNLTQQLVQTVEILKPQAKAKSLHLKLILQDEIPDFVTGDPSRLRQVLINLIHNAIKFTNTGYITVEASVEQKDDEIYTFFCTIKDTGIGIHEDDQEMLFSEFTMVDQSNTRDHEGSGLGLAICTRLIKLMKGNISVTSEINIGSTFSFNIELSTSDETLSHDENLSDIPDQIINPDTRILLAEDNPANQMVMKHILKNIGLQVDIVANGQEVLDAISNIPYDIILMDISMPIMSGITATKKIRQLHSPISKVPIVALTAHSLSGDKKHFLDSGMDDYLTKPVDRSSIVECINRWIKNDSTNTIQTYEVVEPVSIASSEISGDYVDEATLQQLVEDTSADIVPEILRFYIDDGQKRMQEIQNAIKDKDIKSLEFQTHSLGSSAASHGNTKLFNLARKIELLCRNDNQQALKEALMLAEVADMSFTLLKKYADKGFDINESGKPL